MISGTISPEGRAGGRLTSDTDSLPTTPFPGSELVLLEGLRFLSALHGNEAETKKLPAPWQGRLSRPLTLPAPHNDCRALRGCAERRARGHLDHQATSGSLLHPRSHSTMFTGGRARVCTGAIKEDTEARDWPSPPTHSSPLTGHWRSPSPWPPPPGAAAAPGKAGP